MINKIKEYISRNKKGVITFILTNRLFISFIILTVVATSLLKVLTLGNQSFSLKTMFFDVAVAIIFAAFGYIFKPKKQYKYFQTLLIIVCILCTVNLIYFAFFNSFVTIALLETLGQVESVSDAVWDKLNIGYAVFAIFPIVLAYINKKLKGHNYYHYVEKIEKSRKNFSTALLVGIICLCQFV